MLPFSSLHHHDVIIPRSRILHFECHMRTGESRDNMLPFSSLHHHDVIIPRSRILHFECHMRTGESRDNMLPAVIEQECP